MSDLPVQPAAPRPSWPKLIAIALLVTVAGQLIPTLILKLLHDHLLQVYVRLYKYDIHRLWMLLLLVIGLALTLPTARRSGLTFGRVRGLWWKCLLIAAVPILLTLIVYPLLPSRPFAGTPAWHWYLVPPAEDLIFIGFLYGHFARRGAGSFNPRTPINPALLCTALFFSLWHVPNFLSDIPPGFVAFQLLYVFVFTLWVGMTRVLTGSIVYALFMHMSINFIAVHG